MRALIALLVAAVVCCMVGAVAAAPSGTYCGSYMFVIKGKISFRSEQTFDLDIDTPESKSHCQAQRFKLEADGAVTLPDAELDGNCIGELMRGNGLSGLKIKYNAGRNTIDLDAGVADITLKSC